MLESSGAEVGLVFDPQLGRDAVLSGVRSIPRVDSAALGGGYLPGQLLRVPLLPGGAVTLAPFLELPGVTLASRAYRTDAGAELLFPTSDLLVMWAEGASAQSVASLEATFGLQPAGTIEMAAGPLHRYTIEAETGGQAIRRAHTLALLEATRIAIPDFVMARTAFDCVPGDPLYVNQWHHEDANSVLAIPGSDTDVPAVWEDPTSFSGNCFDLGDPNLTVAVVDTGFKLGHEDLVDAYLRDAFGAIVGYNAWAPGSPPSASNNPFGPDQHATRVAGVVSAQVNKTGGVGVAPGCRLMPIKLITETLPGQWTVGMEAACFNFALLNGADVVNCSWGPSPAFAPSFFPVTTKLALDELAQLGRNGLGSVVVFAVGNSAKDVTPNDYGSHTNVIGVAASNSNATLASYSNFGLPVDLCAPGGLGGGLGITTTATGPKYVDNFGGTSASAPIVAGAALLLLSEYPWLHWREVKEVLEDTADKIAPGAAAYEDLTGHSAMGFGYGKVNIERALTDPVNGPGKYELSAGVQRYGWGTPGTTGVPLIDCDTPIEGDSTFAVRLTEARPNALGFFLLGFAPRTQVPGISSFGNAIAVDLASLALNPIPVIGTDSFGEASAGVNLLPGSVGLTIYAQFIIDDAGTPTQGAPSGGNSLSRGLAFTIQP